MQTSSTTALARASNTEAGERQHLLQTKRRLGSLQTFLFSVLTTALPRVLFYKQGWGGGGTEVQVG